MAGSLRSSATTAELTDYSGYIYININAQFDAAFTDGKITDAELLVESKIHSTLSATTAAKYKQAVLIIAAQKCMNELIKNGYVKESKHNKFTENYFTDEVMAMISDDSTEKAVDIIPMYRTSQMRRF